MGYLLMLVSATVVLTAAIYGAMPIIGGILAAPLGDLPMPHVVIGAVVVVILAMALILYLRSGD